VLVASAARASAQRDVRYHLGETERETIVMALERAATWLTAQQDADGSFRPRVRREACPVAITGVATWALAVTDPLSAREENERKAVAWLRGWVQADGGIYDPSGGLAVFTSGFVAGGLELLARRWSDPTLLEQWRLVDTFAAKPGATESLVDVEGRTGTTSVASIERATALLGRTPESDEGMNRALQFLSVCNTAQTERPPVRTRGPRSSTNPADIETMQYDDMLVLSHRPTRHDWPITLRALRAIQALYVLDRNPDLTQRYGEAGFQPGTQGLYYYYLLLARVLSTLGVPTLDLLNGEQHDWVRELTATLLARQHEDGSWVNSDPTWWEDEPVLVTSYCMLALERCLEMREPPTKR
jgi:hypothetical protein